MIFAGERMKHFDLVVIGAGPGGYVAAIRAAQLGMRVAVAERDKPGGVCVNWGCIPSKAILTSAELYEDMKNAAAYGIRVQGLSADYGEVIRRSRKVADRMSRGIAYLFKKNGSSFPRQRDGRFATTVRVGRRSSRAQHPRGLGDGGPRAAGDRAGRPDHPDQRRRAGPGGAAALRDRSGGGRWDRVRIHLPGLRRRSRRGGDGGPAPPRTDREVAQELSKALQKQGIRILTSAPAKSYNKVTRTLTVSVAGRRRSSRQRSSWSPWGAKFSPRGWGWRRAAWRSSEVSSRWTTGSGPPVPPSGPSAM